MTWGRREIGCSPQEEMLGDVVVRAWVLEPRRSCQQGRKELRTPKVRRWLELWS